MSGSASKCKCATRHAAITEKLNQNTVTVISGNPNGAYLYLAYDMSAVLDDGNDCGCYRCRRSVCGGGKYSHPATDQIGRQSRQSIVLTLRPTIFDCYVSALGS